MVLFTPSKRMKSSLLWWSVSSVGLAGRRYSGKKNFLWNSIKFRNFTQIILTKERHDQLVNAEIADFALKSTAPLTIHEIQRQATCADSCRYLYQELPIRFAARIKQLETLPSYQSNSLILSVRNIYVESFKRLRNSRWDLPEDFKLTLQNLKKRHASIVPMLVTGLRSLMEQFPEQLTLESVDIFLNEFFQSRIGTEMLTSNFLSPNGIVDPQCDPMLVLKRSAEDAERLCYHHYQCCPKVMIWNLIAQRLPCVPQYLYYILYELFKNAMRAIIEHEKQLPTTVPFAMEIETLRNGIFDTHQTTKNHYEGFGLLPHYESRQSSGDYLPIQVVLSGDDQEVAIKMSDQGGGIDRSSMSHIWSYMYTTARPVILRSNINKLISSDSTPMPKVGSLDTAKIPSDPEDTSINAISPLAGFGCGLPLSKLYASYLGGCLRIISMPFYGTDAYIFLKRIGGANGNGKNALDSLKF